MAPGDELLAAILANPQVDEHRRVYADWLSERGDPRGEFILLQLMEHDRRATKLSRERARQLIRMHAKAWLGPLDHVLDRKSVVFERGFPIRAVCKPGLRKPERYFGEPSWATFEHLSDPPLALLRQPNVVALRSISLHRDQVQQLLRDPQPLPNVAALEVRGSKGQHAVIIGEERQLYERSTCLPELASLRLVHFQVGIAQSWYWATQLGKLRRLGFLAARIQPVGLWAQWLRQMSIALESLTLGDAELEITLAAGEANEWDRATLRLLAISPEHDRVHEHLEHLRARGVTQIAIEDLSR
ncbi:MAG TPA: TIGR02996 domain-containing protein [Enhygromyxa sp.]|nr:TIGR02996 domain-containing protein [Enhygromyxa sp.]